MGLYVSKIFGSLAEEMPAPIFCEKSLDGIRLRNAMMNIPNAIINLCRVTTVFRDKKRNVGTEFLVMAVGFHPTKYTNLLP